MVLQEFITQFAFAILIGSLVGLEREHTRITSKKSKYMPIFGMRTTVLFAILGFLFSFLGNFFGVPLLIPIGIITALVIATSVYLANVWLNHHLGATTYITILIVFFLGGIIGFGGYTNFLIAASVALVTTAFLASKKMLVSWAGKLTQNEIMSAVKFGIIAFIVLPLLPNRTLDPFGIFNPYQVWYVVVIVSLIYFVSYILMKQFAQKGLVLSSLFGGLISGSLTAYQLAQWVSKSKKLIPAATAGVFLAVATGVIGDMIVVGFVFNAWELLLWIIPAQIVGVLSVTVFSFFEYRHKASKKFNIKLESPFAFKPAIKFGLLYLALIAISTVLSTLLGVYGLVPIAILASIVSSSTFIASAAGLFNNAVITVADASLLVIVATAVSFLVKIFWVYTANNIKFTKRVAIGILISTVLLILTYSIQIFIFAR